MNETTLVRALTYITISIFGVACSANNSSQRQATDSLGFVAPLPQHLKYTSVVFSDFEANLSESFTDLTIYWADMSGVSPSPNQANCLMPIIASAPTPEEVAIEVLDSSSEATRLQVNSKKPGCLRFAGKKQSIDIVFTGAASIGSEVQKKLLKDDSLTVNSAFALVRANLPSSAFKESLEIKEIESVGTVSLHAIHSSLENTKVYVSEPSIEQRSTHRMAQHVKEVFKDPESMGRPEFLSQAAVNRMNAVAHFPDIDANLGENNAFSWRKALGGTKYNIWNGYSRDQRILQWFLLWATSSVGTMFTLERANFDTSSPPKFKLDAVPADIISPFMADFANWQGDKQVYGEAHVLNTSSWNNPRYDGQEGNAFLFQYEEDVPGSVFDEIFNQYLEGIRNGLVVGHSFVLGDSFEDEITKIYSSGANIQNVNEHKITLENGTELGTLTERRKYQAIMYFPNAETAVDQVQDFQDRYGNFYDNQSINGDGDVYNDEEVYQRLFDMLFGLITIAPETKDISTKRCKVRDELPAYEGEFFLVPVRSDLGSEPLETFIDGYLCNKTFDLSETSNLFSFLVDPSSMFRVLSSGDGGAQIYVMTEAEVSGGGLPGGSLKIDPWLAYWLLNIHETQSTSSLLDGKRSFLRTLAHQPESENGFEALNLNLSGSLSQLIYDWQKFVVETHGHSNHSIDPEKTIEPRIYTSRELPSLPEEDLADLSDEQIQQVLENISDRLDREHSNTHLGNLKSDELSASDFPEMMISSAGEANYFPDSDKVSVIDYSIEQEFCWADQNLVSCPYSPDRTGALRTESRNLCLGNPITGQGVLKAIPTGNLYSIYENRAVFESLSDIYKRLYNNPVDTNSYLKDTTTVWSLRKFQLKGLLQLGELPGSSYTRSLIDLIDLWVGATAQDPAPLSERLLTSIRHPRMMNSNLLIRNKDFWPETKDLQLYTRGGWTSILPAGLDYHNEYGSPWVISSTESPPQGLGEDDQRRFLNAPSLFSGTPTFQYTEDGSFEALGSPTLNGQMTSLSLHDQIAQVFYFEDGIPTTWSRAPDAAFDSSIKARILRIPDFIRWAHSIGGQPKVVFRKGGFEITHLTEAGNLPWLSGPDLSTYRNGNGPEAAALQLLFNQPHGLAIPVYLWSGVSYRLDDDENETFSENLGSEVSKRDSSSLAVGQAAYPVILDPTASAIYSIPVPHSAELFGQGVQYAANGSVGWGLSPFQTAYINPTGTNECESFIPYEDNGGPGEPPAGELPIIPMPPSPLPSPAPDNALFFLLMDIGMLGGEPNQCSDDINLFCEQQCRANGFKQGSCDKVFAGLIRCECGGSIEP